MRQDLLNKKKSAKETNPFYKMTATLALMTQIPKMGDNTTESTVNSYLDAAWKECKDRKDKRQLFFSILFSIGDITNREHNVFRLQKIKKPDQGGFGLRKAFIFVVKWMLKKSPEQFYSLLPLIGEYYNIGAGITLQYLRTDRFKGTVKENIKVDLDVEKMTDYIASVLLNKNTTDNEKALWAKWLWSVPKSSRTAKFTVTEIGLKSVQKKYGSHYKVGDTVTRKRDKQAVTKAKDADTIKCIELLSNKMDWEIEDKGEYKVYSGYKAFRTQYLKNTEAALFSSHRITQFDKTQFMDWMETLPSGARYRVQCRVLDKNDAGVLVPKDKWVLDTGENIGTLFLEWIEKKEKAQQAMRNLSDEDKEKLRKEDPDKLHQMEKAAKVNTGGTNLMDLFAKMFDSRTSSKEVDIASHAILDKIKLQVPVLVMVDISGSMASSVFTHEGVTFRGRDVAALAATIFMTKNPNPDLRNMFIRFDNSAEVIYSGANAHSEGENRYMSTYSTKVPELVDPKLNLFDNVKTVSKYCIARGGTSFNVVADYLHSWVKGSGKAHETERIDMINEYPVILVVSDGDMNGYGNPAQTMNDFQQKMRQWFGWEGLVVVWDTAKSWYSNTNKFEGLENVMYFGGTNPAILNQIFLNIHDLDIIDVYTALKSMYESNRYEPVRRLVG